MVVSRRIPSVLIAVCILIGCAQAPTRPAPERKPIEGVPPASSADDPSRASGPQDPSLPEAQATSEPAAESAPQSTGEPIRRALSIHLDSQRFVYREGDEVVRTGPISSGKEGHGTPTGQFSVLGKQRDKVSSRYTNQLGWNAWMPYSIQFNGHYFLHEGWLPGYPDSHGCVRVGEKDARFLFEKLQVGDPVTVAN